VRQAILGALAWKLNCVGRYFMARKLGHFVASRTG
jgi:hypothetical protein